MPLPLLICGYGNPGRGDDGLGIALAEAAEKWGLPGVTVQACYQLNAEDALALSGAGSVIFADASKKLKEGFTFTPLEPSSGISFTTHAMAPGSVASLCMELYGKCPPCYILEMAGDEWGLGEGLSDKGSDSLAKAVSFLKAKLGHA